MVHISVVIEWWLRTQNKLDGAKVSTLDGVITEWEVDGVPQPTEDEFVKIRAEYDAHVTDAESKKDTRKQAVIDKFKALGFTESQIDEFLV